MPFGSFAGSGVTSNGFRRGFAARGGGVDDARVDVGGDVVDGLLVEIVFQDLRVRGAIQVLAESDAVFIVESNV